MTVVQHFTCHNPWCIYVEGAVLQASLCRTVIRAAQQGQTSDPLCILIITNWCHCSTLGSLVHPLTFQLVQQKTLKVKDVSSYLHPGLISVSMLSNKHSYVKFLQSNDVVQWFGLNVNCFCCCSLGFRAPCTWMCCWVTAYQHSQHSTRVRHILSRPCWTLATESKHAGCSRADQGKNDCLVTQHQQ